MVLTSTNTRSRFISYLPFLTLMSFVSLVNILARVIYSPITPFICNEMKLSHIETGNIFLVLALGFAITLFASQYLSAMFSHKFTVIFSVITSGLAIMLTAHTEAFEQFRLAIFTVGISSGLFVPSAVALIRENVPSYHLGKAFGVFGTAQSFAFILSPLCIDFFVQFMKWRDILYIFGLLSIFLGLFFLFFMPKKEQKSLPVTFSFIRKVLSWPSFWILNLLLCVINGLNIGIYNMAPDFFERHNLLAMQDVNQLIICARTIGILTALIGGYLIDRLGFKKSLVAVLALCGAVTILMGAARNPMVALIFFCAQSPIAACLMPMIHFGMTTIVPTEKNAAIVSIMAPFGFAFGAGIVPQVLGLFGNYNLYGEGFITFGFASITCALLFSINGVYKHVHLSQFKSTESQ